MRSSNVGLGVLLRGSLVAGLDSEPSITSRLGVSVSGPDAEAELPGADADGPLGLIAACDGAASPSVEAAAPTLGTTGVTVIGERTGNVRMRASVGVACSLAAWARALRSGTKRSGIDVLTGLSGRTG